MATIEELFKNAENGTLTYSQFEKAAKEAGIKVADLSTGDYVSKSKFEAEIQSKDSQIKALNETIATRDTDLQAIKTQLESAGADKSKLDELNDSLAKLQGKYDTDIKAYQDKLSKQSYEFAVKEFADTKKFTSKAAKRDFVNSMISRGLQMEGDKIIGAEDFVSVYSTDNSDAFVQEKQKPEPEKQKPQFTAPTGTTPAQGDKNGFPDFGFVGVRPHGEK